MRSLFKAMEICIHDAVDVTLMSISFFPKSQLKKS